MEIQGNEALALKQEQGKGRGGQNQAGDHFKPEGMADSIMVSAAEKLGAKDSCAGDHPENADIIDKQQLVHNGHARHLFRAHHSHHNVVQKADKICDAVLNHDRHGDH